jgi:hypothetical protein
MVPASLGAPETTEQIAHTPIEEVLRIAGKNCTEPFCSTFGPVPGPGSKPAFAALVLAYNTSGGLDAAWMSEPIFDSSEAAQDYAEDVCGPEIWSILGGCEW